MKALYVSVVLLLSSFLSLGSQAALLGDCVAVGNGNGGSVIENHCVVDGGTLFTWEAEDPDALPADILYDYQVPDNGNDKLASVSAVLAYLFDWGMERVGGNVNNNEGYVRFYEGEDTTLDFMYLGSNEEDGFAIDSDDGGLSGSFTIDGLSNVMTVKAANSFSLFLFDDWVDSGSWDTSGILNGGGQQPELSHVSWWKLGTPPPVDVPEPAPLLLLGFMVLLWRRLYR